MAVKTFTYPLQNLTVSTGALATSAKQDEQTALLTTIASHSDDYIRESTALIDTSSTNIPGSASNSLSVITSTAQQTNKIQSVEDIGEYIGVYTGAVASPVLVGILPLGGGEINVNIAAGTRISLRSMTASAISVGKIVLNMVG